MCDDAMAAVTEKDACVNRQWSELDRRAVGSNLLALTLLCVCGRRSSPVCIVSLSVVCFLLSDSITSVPYATYVKVFLFFQTPHIQTTN